MAGHVELVEGVLPAVLVALSTLMGLVATVVTFVCSNFYATNTKAVQRMRDLHGRTISNSWVGSIAWTISTAIVAILGVLFTVAGHPLVVLITVTAMTSVSILKAARAVMWLDLLLKSADRADRVYIPERITV